LAFVSSLVVGVGLCVLAAAHIWWGDWNLDRRLAAEAAVAGLGALYVTAVAGIIALIAYGLASRRPVLAIELRPRPWEAAAQPTLIIDGDSRATILTYPRPPVDIAVRLVNWGSFSARNPAVRLELQGLTSVLKPDHDTLGWQQVPPIHFMTGLAWLWNGGVDTAIHGHGWLHDLPRFRLARAVVLGESASLNIKAVADGDSHEETYQFDVITIDEWAPRHWTHLDILPYEYRKRYVVTSLPPAMTSAETAEDGTGLASGGVFLSDQQSTRVSRTDRVARRRLALLLSCGLAIVLMLAIGALLLTVVLLTVAAASRRG
jgi:hypothetical protein